MSITQNKFDSAKESFSKRKLSVVQKQNILSTVYGNEGDQSVRLVMRLRSSNFSSFKKKILATLSIIGLLFSGTAYASAHSLPGDFLYDMKVRVIEPIGLALRFDEESKNAYKIRLLEKRVEEIEQLKQKNRLDDNAQRASSEATSDNVKELERSAIFNAEGENTTISEQVEIYNDLIEPSSKIETRIIIDSNEASTMPLEVDFEKIEEQSMDAVQDSIDNTGIGIGKPKEAQGVELNNFSINTEENVQTEVELPGL